MSTAKELNYRLYIQQSNDFIRTDLRSEFDRYNGIKNGDVDAVISNYNEIRKDFLKGKGILSQDPLRNHIYHLVVSAGVISRVCIDAGLPHNEGYTLTDIYIQKADQCKTCEEVIELLGKMQVDFAERMSKIQRGKEFSVHIRHAIDNIYDHLQDALTMEELAEAEKLNPSYFSKLFHKETGHTVKAFIIKAKLSTARNMLQQSSHTISEISHTLGFCTQSAFTAAFRKEYGITPKECRNQYSYAKVYN